jgi:hypothetical protein
MADRAGGGAVLVPAAVIEMVVGVNDEIDVAWLQSDLCQGSRNRLLLRLRRLLEGQHAHDVVIVIARVVEITAVLVLNQNGIAREAKLAARTSIPECMETVDHQRAAIEQIDLGIRHLLVPPVPYILPFASHIGQA